MRSGYFVVHSTGPPCTDLIFLFWRVLYCEIWCFRSSFDEDCQVTNLLKDYSAFIFRVKQLWTLTLKMNALQSFETLVTLFQLTLHNIPEDFSLWCSILFVTQVLNVLAVPVSFRSAYENCCDITGTVPFVFIFIPFVFIFI
jgi:hypothetical protein